MAVAAGLTGVRSASDFARGATETPWAPMVSIARVLIYVFAIQLGWLAVQGYQRLADGFGGFIERLILPRVALATVYVALIARITRGSDRLDLTLRQS